MIGGKVTGEADYQLLDTSAFIDECNKLLVKAAKSMNGDFRAATHTWKHKPLFWHWGPFRRGNLLYIFAGPTTYEGRDELFEWVDEGTKPHTIRPKVAGRMLRFQSKYRAKTTPYSLYSRPGGKSGRYTYRRMVHHPGIKGRQFIELSAANHQPWWNTKVAELMDRFGRVGAARRIRKVYN